MQVRAWVRGLVVAEGLAAVMLVTWWMRQPAPEVPTILPALPSREQLQAAAVAVAIPEAVFPKPAPKPTATPQAASPAVAVETAASWRVLGIDQGPPPTALLKEVKEGGAKVWVKVGDRLGDFTVKAIALGRVVLEGPGGEFEIRL